jgi:extracellular factor (EF) 3-hydroxypalmitic acid methyl ester biosynthesis protein
MTPVKLISAVRTYEELEGAQGREVFFRPHRIRATELLPLRSSVALVVNGAEITCALHDVSQNGVAFEWPAHALPATGDRLDQLAVTFDRFEAYRGEARVGSVREVEGVNIVGVSFEGPLLPVDDVLNLRALATWPGAGADVVRPPVWRTEGADRYKVLVSDLALFLEDAQEDLTRLEKDLPWHVLHGEDGSPARLALIDRLKTAFVGEVVRATEEIDAAFRPAAASSVPALGEWSRRHLHDYFLQSPVMLRAFQKPFGYPGDYEVMRFLYEKPFEGPTLFAKAMSLAFDQTKAGLAVRGRKDVVKARLRSLIESRDTPLRFLSVAAGPAQELFELLSEIPEIPAPIELVLFDQDKGALGYAFRRLRPLVEQRWAGKVKLIYLNESIKTLLTNEELFKSFGQFDAIFCSGLYDYLQAATAVRLTRTLESQLAPGGIALIANITPENPCRWYMEQHLDWKLIHRSRPELLEIARRAAPDAHREILEEASGVNPFVQLTRG